MHNCPVSLVRDVFQFALESLLPRKVLGRVLFGDNGCYLVHGINLLRYHVGSGLLNIETALLVMHHKVVALLTRREVHGVPLNIIILHIFIIIF